MLRTKSFSQRRDQLRLFSRRGLPGNRRKQIPVLLIATFAHLSNDWAYPEMGNGWEYPLLFSLMPITLSLRILYRYLLVSCSDSRPGSVAQA